MKIEDIIKKLDEEVIPKTEVLKSFTQTKWYAEFFDLVNSLSICIDKYNPFTSKIDLSDVKIDYIDHKSGPVIMLTVLYPMFYENDDYNYVKKTFPIKDEHLDDFGAWKKYYKQYMVNKKIDELKRNIEDQTSQLESYVDLKTELKDS